LVSPRNVRSEKQAQVCSGRQFHARLTIGRRDADSEGSWSKSRANLVGFDIVFQSLAKNMMGYLARTGSHEAHYCLCVTVLCTIYNGAQRYEQFLQVGRLYRALILLGSALCLPSTSVSSWGLCDSLALLLKNRLTVSGRASNQLTLISSLMETVDCVGGTKPRHHGSCSSAVASPSDNVCVKARGGHFELEM